MVNTRLPETAITISGLRYGAHVLRLQSSPATEPRRSNVIDALDVLDARVPDKIPQHIPPPQEAIARCSMEYVIAAENSPAIQMLGDMIGSDAAFLTQDAQEKIVTEAMTE